MSHYEYVGEELELFARAVNWKAYFRSHLRKYLHGDVLEVGAGLGGTTAVLLDDVPKRWVALEPDPQLAAQLTKWLESRGSKNVEVRLGTVADLAAGGALIVLSPAHQFLFSPFDKALGHFRRYSARELRAIGPPGLKCETIRYLDSAGMILSLGNKLLLRQSIPTAKQIHVWDRYFVPISRVVDRLLGYRLGKSIIGVWRNEGGRV